MDGKLRGLDLSEWAYGIRMGF